MIIATAGLAFLPANSSTAATARPASLLERSSDAPSSAVSAFAAWRSGRPAFCLLYICWGVWGGWGAPFRPPLCMSEWDLVPLIKLTCSPPCRSASESRRETSSIPRRTCRTQNSFDDVGPNGHKARASEPLSHRPRRQQRQGRSQTRLLSDAAALGGGVIAVLGSGRIRDQTRTRVS